MIFFLIILAAAATPADIARGHDPHGDCTHLDWEPWDLILGNDSDNSDHAYDDMCNGLDHDGSLMKAGELDDHFSGLGGPDEIHGQFGDDVMEGNYGDDELLDGADDYDSDHACDGHGWDEVGVTDEPACCYGYEDTIHRVEDGYSNEPTNKDPWDDIYYGGSC